MKIEVNDKREIVITCDIPCAERLVALLSYVPTMKDDPDSKDAVEIIKWIQNTVALIEGGLVAPGELGSSTPPTLPRMTVERQSGAIYVYISDKPVAETEHYSDVVNADFDADEHLVGVEILPI